MTALALDEENIRTRLLECSVSEDLIKQLDSSEARDLLIHVLLLIGKHQDNLGKED